MALSSAAFVNFVYNAALLLVLAFLYDLIARRFRHHTLTFKVLTGLVLGLIAIAVMVAAWPMPNGVFFDTRSVVLSMGTLFYGTVPGMIAGVIAATYRAILGGSGAVMGVSVIAMSVAVGAVWRQLRHVARRDPNVLELYLFGLTVHALMLLLTTTLPNPLETLRAIAVPVIVVYPLASVVLGLLMVDQRRRRRSVTALRESEERYRSLFEDSPVAMWEEDHSAVKARLEALQSQGVDDIDGHLRTHPDEYTRCVELCRTLDANKAAVRLFEASDREELIARNSELYGTEGGRSLHLFWSAMLAGERSVTCEESNVSLKGRTLHVLETCTVVPGHEATFDRVYIADVDVGERRKADEAIRASAVRLQGALHDTVRAMGTIVELRDPYTALHERQVTRLAEAIAVEMGIEPEVREGLAMAGQVHDVGKIAVPAEILSKPAELTDMEFAIVRQHPAVGRELVSGIDFGRPVARIVGQHHERLDGSGYPDGLKGDEILLEARILAVADVVEAIASHRPYRPALGIEAALAEVRGGAGTLYDADTVAACESVIAAGFSFEG